MPDQHGDCGNRERRPESVDGQSQPDRKRQDQRELAEGRAPCGAGVVWHRLSLECVMAFFTARVAQAVPPKRDVLLRLGPNVEGLNGEGLNVEGRSSVRRSIATRVDAFSIAATSAAVCCAQSVAEKR